MILALVKPSLLIANRIKKIFDKHHKNVETSLSTRNLLMRSCALRGIVFIPKNLALIIG
jgi:hypothetical protein